jgi:4-hydroxy-tetrahydrodipicolinate synthase
MTLRLRGTGTAIVTPFTSAGAVDEAVLRSLIEWQIASGVDFLVPCGSTGEAQTMSEAERQLVITTTVEAAAGRVPVVGGVSGNDTARVVEEVRTVAGFGVDAVMLVTPHYNKPTQAGLMRHFTEAADGSPRPLVMYTVPGRTAVHMHPETVLRLAEHPNIIAVKDATGDLGWAMTVLRQRPEGFLVLSGEDGLVLPHMACGGDGVISVASNAVPDLVAEMTRAGLTGDWAAARAMQFRLLPLIDLLFRESNPIPVKAALHLLGRLENVLRLPLMPASPETVSLLAGQLSGMGLMRAAGGIR